MQHEKYIDNSNKIQNEEIDESPWGDEEKEAKDSRLRRLEDLIRAYKGKTNKTPPFQEEAASIALWLHRWMVTKIQSIEFHERLGRDILSFLSEEKGVSAKSLFPDIVGLGRFLRWEFEALRTELY